MRVFFGIFLPSPVKKSLSSIQYELKRNSKKGNFTLFDNLHLTLRFIGEVNDEELDQLKEVLTEVSKKVSAFEFKFNHLDQFKRGNSAIVYAGVETNNKLSSTYQILLKELEERGFQVDHKPYTPHITLGREVRFQEEYLLDEENKLNIDDVNVTEIALIESKRVNGILRYLPVKTEKIKKED